MKEQNKDIKPNSSGDSVYDDSVYERLNIFPDEKKGDPNRHSEEIKRNQSITTIIE